MIEQMNVLLQANRDLKRGGGSLRGPNVSRPKDQNCWDLTHYSLQGPNFEISGFGAHTKSHFSSVGSSIEAGETRYRHNGQGNFLYSQVIELLFAS